VEIAQRKAATANGRRSKQSFTGISQIQACRMERHKQILLPPSRPQSKQRVLTAGQASQPHVRPPGKATEGLEQPSAFPFLPQVTSPASSLASGSVSVPAAFSTALPK
jgi:hypothetical protein